MSDNFVQPVIQEDILDNHHLLRRIPNDNPDMYKFDQNMNAYRPTSACFSNRQLSVTHEEDLLGSGASHQHALAGNDDYGLVALNAGFIKNELGGSQEVYRDPVEDNQFHCLIDGDKSTAVRKKISKHSVIRIDFRPVDAEL